MSADPDMSAKVALLASAFLAKLPARLDSIDAAYAQCSGGGQEAWTELHRLLHSLGGAAGTFGLPELGLEARRIEHLIDSGQFASVGLALAGLRAYGHHRLA